MSDQTDFQHTLTHDGYFALEQCEDQRYKYFAGEVFAMDGEPRTLC